LKFKNNLGLQSIKT